MIIGFIAITLFMDSPYNSKTSLLQLKEEMASMTAFVVVIIAQPAGVDVNLALNVSGKLEENMLFYAFLIVYGPIQWIATWNKFL